MTPFPSDSLRDEGRAPICPCGSNKATVNFRSLIDHDWRNIDSKWAVKCEDCGQYAWRSLAEISGLAPHPHPTRRESRNEAGPGKGVANART